MTGNAMCTAADRKGKPVEIRHNCEHGFIGDVIADEQGTASLEGLMHHQFAHAGRLAAKPECLISQTHLPGNTSIGAFGKSARIRRHRFIDRLLRMRCETVMQRQRIALVFEQDLQG